MTFGGKKSTALLFVGDIGVFIFSLWFMLVVRYFALPSSDTWWDHFIPFSLLFCLWILVFYMVGLYSKRAIFFKKTLWGVILRTQLINIILAALFFFFIPGIGIAPKTNLILYLIVSSVFISIWRVMLFPRITRPSQRARAAIIGEGPEVSELVTEVNENARYRFEFRLAREPKQLLTPQAFEMFAQELIKDKVSILVVDADHESLKSLLPRIYELAFSKRGYEFLNFYDLYEEVFDRVPLSLLQYDWFLKNISNSESNFYIALKRIVDIAGGLVMGLITLIVTPFVFIAMRIEGPGPLFIMQMRFGKDDKRVSTFKFRSMGQNDGGKWRGETENKVTKVGQFLRQTSLDEFPQCINVLRGELSLVGPRNDIEVLGIRLAEAIPYYNIRYIVKPGITGWAQINQQYEPGNISPQSIEETKTRLAYDFYYIKNRSLSLDMIIALKTIKRMFFRVSSW